MIPFCNNFVNFIDLCTKDINIDFVSDIVYNCRIMTNISGDKMVNPEDRIVKFNIQKNLIKLRDFNNVTQQSIADALNIERSTYSSWESGRSCPKPAQIVKLAEIYNISTDFIMRDNSQSSFTVNCDSEYKKSTQKVYGDTFLSELNDYERTVIMKVRLLNSNDKSELLNHLDSIRNQND